MRDGGLVARLSFCQLRQVRRARAAGTPIHLIAHEDVLVFAKPQPAAGEATGGALGTQLGSVPGGAIGVGGVAA